jgi:hypothetical protein
MTISRVASLINASLAEPVDIGVGKLTRRARRIAIATRYDLLNAAHHYSAPSDAVTLGIFGVEQTEHGHIFIF